MFWPPPHDVFRLVAWVFVIVWFPLGAFHVGRFIGTRGLGGSGIQGPRAYLIAATVAVVFGLACGATEGCRGSSGGGGVERDYDEDDDDRPVAPPPSTRDKAADGVFFFAVTIAPILYGVRRGRSDWPIP